MTGPVLLVCPSCGHGGQPLIQISVPAAQDINSPLPDAREAEGFASSSVACVPVKHDPLLRSDLDHYRQAFHRHKRDREALRVKSSLPVWQIVKMYVRRPSALLVWKASRLTD